MSGPARTGSVEPFKRADGTTYFRGRIRLGDGSRTWIDVPDKYRAPAGGKTARERSELYVAARQEREDETGELLAEKRAREAKKAAQKAAPLDTSRGESADAWYDRYHAYAKELGQTDADKKRDRWRKWIGLAKVRSGATTFGTLSMVAVTRDDVEDVRDALDRAIEEWKVTGKSAGKRGRAISGKTAMKHLVVPDELLQGGEFEQAARAARA